MKHTGTASEILLVFTDIEPEKEFLLKLESSLNVLDYVDEHFTLFVRNGSSKDIRQIMLTLKNDKEFCLCLGDLARTRYNAHYTGPKYTVRIAALINEVSTDGRSKAVQT